MQASTSSTPGFKLLSWLLQCFGHIQSKNKDAKSAMSIQQSVPCVPYGAKRVSFIIQATAKILPRLYHTTNHKLLPIPSPPPLPSSSEAPHIVGVAVDVAPLVNYHEHQPAKQKHQEQHLGGKLQCDVDVPLEVTANKHKSRRFKTMYIYVGQEYPTFHKSQSFM